MSSIYHTYVQIYPNYEVINKLMKRTLTTIYKAILMALYFNQQGPKGDRGYPGFPVSQYYNVVISPLYDMPCHLSYVQA